MRRPDPINGKRLQHNWTEEERTVLALLHKVYDVSSEQRIRIWNEIYREVLRVEGFPATGYPQQAMVSQVSEMKRGGTGSQPWQNVMWKPLSEARQCFFLEREKIEAACQDLRISLRLRFETPATQPQIAKNLLNRKPVVATARADQWSTSSSDECEMDRESPCEQLKKNKQSINNFTVQKFAFQQNKEQLNSEPILPSGVQSRNDINNDAATGRYPGRPLLKIRDPNSRDSTRQVPALLFRAFLEGHGNRARRFLTNKNPVPPPPPMRSETFLEKVNPHLQDYLPQHATYPSPFLSLTDSPQRALEIIQDEQLPRSLAIYDTAEIIGDARKRYGDICLPYPYLVPAICDTHGIDDLPDGYYGVGEWLCWGSIECQPVAVFDYFKALALLATMVSIKKARKLNSETGEVLGVHLTAVPDKYKALISYKLMRVFKVKGYLRGPSSKYFKKFINAIYEVTGGDRAISALPDYPLQASLSTKVVVEIPVARRDEEKGREQENESGITWQVINDGNTDRQISVVLPKPALRVDEGSRDVQEMVDAQLESDGVRYGLEVDRASTLASQLSEPAIPPDTFLRELYEQAALPTPPPIPPPEYKSSAANTQPDGNSNRELLIIDLCGEDGDDDEIQELPSFDLTREEEEQEEEDCAVVASVRRGGGAHSVLSIRSRSLSSAAVTPKRPIKAIRGRKVQTK